MKTTVKPHEFTTSEITAYALKELNLRNFEVWRNNNVRAVRGRTFTGKKGVADIMGFHRTTGKLVACEVKKIGDTLSQDQIDFLTDVKKAGAIALLATQQSTSIVVRGY